jgi:Ni,Fe-hydrogenase III component G
MRAVGVDFIEVGEEPRDCRLPHYRSADRAKSMKGALIKQEMLTLEARKLRESGGRMQFAYGWTPHGGDSEIRYATALPGQSEFEIWVLKSADIVPSLALIWQLVGWYEREMTDLNGIQFANHPEPSRSTRRSVDPRK